ncbi:hypothetical protein [methanotrophic endosymbiont of Bathymodiolus puteoserpentis (Logatchev)]|jgi:hypothetical protein|uniref:hypothetical protein n=1 Tax=methanotrophic endosymbiont of Bathymodiolus puteoserpentis (Logatchev) TaxID=343235 RepID=UPI0013CDBB41|nr:hypothetical protein [methanotrophic endosymbiont of Bathymodiolus puteoserpentis (Logatchev)]SHE21642.1 hypothetical protein BPUTEOMOX_1090 [methanotrophic endosymbiont of Bathymodiolus puteoserpentis (Logatchev)]
MYAIETQEMPDQAFEQTEVLKNSKSMTAKITTYLRWVGSVLIVLSAISFMLQGHDEILPAYRYWIGLGLTLLLCGGGLVCAYLFHETKGARIFFGLGTAFLSVQVSQVSAMIYAYWHGRDALQPEYTWLQFMEVSPTVIVIDLVITGLLLFIVSYASYSILARKYLKTLLTASIIGSVLLIIPVRDATFVPLIVAGLFVFLRRTEQYLHNDSSMRLAEGMAARVLVSLPLWIIVGRSLLHPASYLLAVVVSAIVLVYCIYDIKRYTQSAFITYISQWVGTLAAMAIWVIVLAEFGVVGDQLSALLPVAIILFALSGQVSYHARLYRLVSALMTVALTYAAMLDGQTMAPVITIAAGMLLTIAGIKHREKAPFIMGNICVLGGFLFYWEYAVNFYSSAPWISSIVLGLVVILLASYIENKEKQIMAKSRYYFNELKSWN